MNNTKDTTTNNKPIEPQDLSYKSQPNPQDVDYNQYKVYPNEDTTQNPYGQH